MKQDSSEYALTEYERYIRWQTLPPQSKLDVFHNLARFDANSHDLVISVDPSYELCFIEDVEKDYRHTIQNYFNRSTEQDRTPEALPDNKDFDQWKVQKQGKLIKELHKKYPGIIDRSFIERAVSSYVEHYKSKRGEDFQPVQRVVNLFSGSAITLNCGEGILDFIYADFSKPLDTVLKSAYKKAEAMTTEPGSEEESNEPVPNKFHQFLKDLEDYQSTFDLLQKVLYSSLYTAACPPLFHKKGDLTVELEHYKDYLENLQDEYRYLMQLCFDETYHPDILGDLSPAKRFWLYRRGHKQATSLPRKENLLFTTSKIGTYILPPDAFVKEHVPTLTNEEAITPEVLKHEDEYMNFADEMGLESHDLLELLPLPNHVSVGYSFSKVDEMLALEFSKVLEYGIRFRKCQRCGRYFIMKGNYDTHYCDRIAEGETRTCQELAAAEKYKEKIADNKAIPIYNKYYKRYAARVKVRQIKEDEFKKWRYKAISLRDDCAEGKLSPEDYIQWMEDSFPNRKPKTKA